MTPTPEFTTPARAAALAAPIADSRIHRIAALGLSGSAPAFMLAGIRTKRPVLVIADDADQAGYLYQDLKELLGEEAVAYFPSGYRRDIRYGQADPPSLLLRTDTLARLNSPRTSLGFIVTYPEAVAERVPAPRVLAASAITLKTGGRTRMSDIIARLREEGFRETDYVYEPGQFARRGSILDVFSYSNDEPYRIDFFDDEIDSMRTFDIETQLSDNRLKTLTILPEHPGGTEAGDTCSLPESLPADTLVAVQGLAWTLARVRAVTEETFSNSAIIADEGDPESMSRLVSYPEFETALTSMKVLQYGRAADAADGFRPDAAITYATRPQALYHKNFDLIADSFTRLESQGYDIRILSDSEHQAARLRTIFDDRGDDIHFTPVRGTVHEGFIDDDAKICYFTDHQIFDRFHKYTLRSDRARNGKVALSLKELNQIETGDYIVHIDHGIGRFGGLIKTDVNGRPQEMIKLYYQNDDMILVSIHALHKLSKYRGKEGVPPRISKLGTGAWNRLKERTKTKMKEIARDLIRLYAARRQEQGFPFSPDSYLQHELEASFGYEDTPDQITATQAIKADMESPRPMDRLVCGDVGFGKTELAVRAAFKAACDSKQTALLVPTTVLAMQHYRTFTNRLKDLPVRVEFLSRAKKPKEVRRILDDLADGKVDILIGTHKIVGKGVRFHDLGLLIVDEEQKFGVAVKERLKQLKTNVDTLTMSATPIPRTLQFSLMGARDLSSLNTPPANRQPIATTLSTLDDDVIAEAVNFELSRNGQLFMISNRIENLAELEDRLHRVIPGLRTVTVHGQMPPEQVEERILGFAAGEYDLLLSTTIVENGIDMPNVNTILVNNAHHFGLSELHQLRGRVGRGGRKAFCYLFVPPGLQLTPVARRRLQAIESFSDLGSGIHIAMQDLDIRGAGNLLGAEQSGFIADLGYETYQKILKESVTELRTEEFADTLGDEIKPEEYTSDCVIESDLELRLPPEYVPQESERISLYQELDNMERREQTEEFEAHLRDRFGNPPEVTLELIRVVPLRLAARRLGIERLALKGGKMYLYFVGEENKAYYRSPAFGRLLSFLQLNPRRSELRDRNGKRSMLIHKVPDVRTALGLLEQIETLPAL